MLQARSSVYYVHCAQVTRIDIFLNRKCNAFPLWGGDEIDHMALQEINFVLVITS
jgi:hypothetical protein